MASTSTSPLALTHEREIVEQVALCTPDGKRLNGAARGWSRVPLHVANLRGRWGRTKRWDYWAILAGDLVVACTFADLDYLGTVDVFWVDLARGVSGGATVVRPGARGIHLPEVAGATPLVFESAALRLAIVDDAQGTQIDGHWRERDGTRSRLAARIERPRGHESLNVVIPWSESLFQFTSKQHALPARGELEVAGTIHRFGDGAFGVLDVGRGRWPYATIWNWGAAVGSTERGATLALQLGGKWTAGTGFTENGILVDGVLTKLGDELLWSYDIARPMAPWRVRAPDGSLDATLTPRFDRKSRIEAALIGTRVHQLFGRWTGTATTADGQRHAFTAIQGFAEEARWRW